MGYATTIPGTSRQKVTTHAGVELQRQAVYMKEASWDKLREVCYAQRLSGSEVIEKLIHLAYSGMQKDTKNDSTITRNK